jgi:hypothetical protein
VLPDAKILVDDGAVRRRLRSHLRCVKKARGFERNKQASKQTSKRTKQANKQTNKQTNQTNNKPINLGRGFRARNHFEGGKELPPALAGVLPPTKLG